MQSIVKFFASLLFALLVQLLPNTGGTNLPAENIKLTTVELAEPMILPASRCFKEVVGEAECTSNVFIPTKEVTLQASC